MKMDDQVLDENQAKETQPGNARTATAELPSSSQNIRPSLGKLLGGVIAIATLALAAWQLYIANLTAAKQSYVEYLVTAANSEVIATNWNSLTTERDKDRYEASVAILLSACENLEATQIPLVGAHWDGGWKDICASEMSGYRCYLSTGFGSKIDHYTAGIKAIIEQVIDSASEDLSAACGDT